MIKQISIPLKKKDLLSLHIGDVVYLSGTVFTARDQAHQMLLTMQPDELPFDTSSMGLYHCGPLMKFENESWKIISAGPTTSSRLDLFEPEFIQKFGITTIIGKGMMGEKTRISLKNNGVFFVYTGGAGALAADQIQNIEAVHWLDELGMAEAIWIFRVEKFGPVVVAIDSHGKTLFKK